jgi:hypothetical protein
LLRISVGQSAKGNAKRHAHERARVHIDLQYKLIMRPFLRFATAP